MKIPVIYPDWPAPANIVALTTTRQGGISEAPYANFNLAAHTGDNAEHVAHNRHLLREIFTLPNEPAWLQQTHSTIAVKIDPHFQSCEADASYSDEAGQICVVMTADCLPILICNNAGTEVAAIHAGWKGLANGVIETTVNQLQSDPADLLVWLGPAIGPTAFQVGKDVYDLFIQPDSEALAAFNAQAQEKWLANIYQLARLRLKKLGIQAIYGGDYCTYTDEERFFSYRRDGDTGRMASLIYIRDTP